MKRTEIRLGTKVRVIGAPKDSPIYEVEKWITSFVVDLIYKTETGKTVSGGQMDISLLRRA